MPACLCVSMSKCTHDGTHIVVVTRGSLNGSRSINRMHRSERVAFARQRCPRPRELRAVASARAIGGGAGRGEGRAEMAAVYSDDVRGKELISMRKSGRNLVREATTLAPREGRTAMKDKANCVSICAPRTPLGRTEGRDQEAQMNPRRAFTSVRRPRGGRASRLRQPIVAHRPGHPAPAEGRRIER